MIHGGHLKRAILLTADLLEKEKEFINDINVFPVADGDTGTNMAATIKGIAGEISPLNTRSMSIMAGAVADAALEHARGNSGVILSQFFWGFREGVDGREVLNLPEFAYAFAVGTRYAYMAVEKPIEGTILTVMRESAEEAQRIARRIADVGVFLKSVFERAVEALNKTPELLAKIGKPKVIDSGGYGFVLFLEGFLRAFGVTTKGFRVRGIKVERERGAGNLFCSNFLIVRRNGIGREELKRILSSYGDSIVIVGGGEKWKVHIHTERPSEVEKVLSEYGEVIQRRIDKIW